MKHKYKHTPLSWTIYWLGRSIMALTTLHAHLLMRQGKRKR